MNHNRGETKVAGQPSNRVHVIDAVKSPLGFFTLIILVVEGLLAAMAFKASGADFTLLLAAMIAVVFILIGIVAFVAIKHPGVLAPDGRSSFDLEVRLVPDEGVDGFEHLEDGAVYYQKQPGRFSKKNRLDVNVQERNEPYVIVPDVRPEDRTTVWLHHDDAWYATENVVSNRRRLKFFRRESPE
jgi:hypothetical protein